MSEPIRINVDVTNPGQFFACCGLLELADRIDRATTAYFEPGGFLIHADVPRVLDAFFKCVVTVETSEVDDDDDRSDDKPDVDAHRGRTYPMILGEPFELRLDWWREEAAQAQKLKTWTAGQRVTDLLREHHKGKKGVRTPSMRERFSDAFAKCPTDWVREPFPIKSPSPFNFDSRLSRNNALDLGFPNKTEDSVMAFSPAAEVLTLIALQRFRPLTLEIWKRNRYYTWNKPLPAELACVAALGLIPQVSASCFEFPVIRRDAKGRFKLFGHAQPVRTIHD
jgi:CRISPR-associated protein Csb3